MYLELTLKNGTRADLGYMLHKNPANAHEFSLSFGKAHVFFKADATACLLVEADCVDLVKKVPQQNYVNDRAYAASSYLTGAISRAFATALSGRCKDKPELVTQEFEWEIFLPTLRSDDAFIEEMFAPLGYQCAAQKLRCRSTLALLLNQLYVLIPVCDNSKHYYVSTDEIDNLIQHGGTWLPTHPHRHTILKRALKGQKKLMAEVEKVWQFPREDLPKSTPLKQMRADIAVQVAQTDGIHKVCDFGCGSGYVMEQILCRVPGVHVTGVDVSLNALEQARHRLEDFCTNHAHRWTLRQGSLLFRDNHLNHCDLLLLMEVVEHIDAERLPTVEQNVFSHGVKHILVSTPNRDFNPLWGLRHPDHRFEWSHAEFTSWCNSICASYGYRWSELSCGIPNEAKECPTLVALFTKELP